MSSSAYSPRWTPPEKPQKHHCDMPGCSKNGEYRAPKSRFSPINKDHYRFCLDHVTEYNKQWNYFDGMSEMEIEMYWDDLDKGHRPTWKREGLGAAPNGKFTRESLYESFMRQFGDTFGGKAASMEEMAAQIPTPSKKVSAALRVMELQWPVSLIQVKSQFKTLAKKYHPDVSEESDAEERFKRITEAYAIIMEEAQIPAGK